MPSVPEYYYAPSRYEGAALIGEEARKNAKVWFFLPSSTFEFVTTGIFCLSAAALNARFSGRPLPPYKGVWKYVVAYSGGLALSRWADRANVKRYSYEDKVIREYVSLHPDKFPEYKPKTMKETFGRWKPIRSGSADPLDETLAYGRKKDTDHYVPDGNESKA